MTNKKTPSHIALSGEPIISQQPQLLQIKNSSSAFLMNCLENLFSSCDDLFFDLSSRAASNNEQNLYFESMRELRVKKVGAINLFNRQLEQNFDNIGHASNAPQDSTKTEALSLVQEDEIEKDVAINSMISKARINNQEALYNLSTRLDHLIPSNTVNQDNNPLDPHQLCESFAQACETFDVHIKAKIIIYKQFERLVANQLGKIYSTANELLINAGVMPTIASRKASPQQEQASKATQTANSLDENSDIDVQELSSLLAGIRRLGLNQSVGYSAYSANPGPVMSNQELLGAISELPPAPQEFENGSIYTNLRMLIDLILSKANPQQPQAVQQSDEDTINLVAMFFDFVLDDGNLPSAFQALISRLQIPILKVALKDKNFFNQSSHPARQVVNTIASAGVSWDSQTPEKDKLYQLLTKSVQMILENYTADTGIFEKQLHAIERYLEVSDHRRTLIETRTNQAAHGQAITSLAKANSQRTLFEQLEKAQLPESISNFLIKQLQPFMVMSYIKHGKDSQEWLGATQLVQDLMWASQPLSDDKSIARLGKIKQDLLDRIKEGLTETLNSEKEALEAADKMGSVLASIHNSGNETTRSRLNLEQAQALGHTPGGGSKSWKEMTALERQQAQYQALTYESIKKAEALPLNTWVNYELTSEGKTIRCKLASKIEINDRYVFVNRFGFKVIEKSRKDFAYDIQKKKAVPLEATPLFDRAFNSITGNLRNLNSSS